MESYKIGEYIEMALKDYCKKCRKSRCSCCEFKKAVEYVKQLDKEQQEKGYFEIELP